MAAKPSFLIITIMTFIPLIVTLKAAQAQDTSSLPLSEQLKMEYKLAKRGADSSGGSIVEAGTVFVIQKGGILGVPLSNLAMATSTYKDGDLHGPGGFAAGMMGPKTRQLPVGEKVYVTKIDVHPKNDKIMLTIVECDSCNAVQDPSSYKSAIVFQFPKGYLSKADVSQIKDVISQVLTPETSEQTQQAQATPQPTTNQPATTPPTIEPGQTIEQVQLALGQPEKIVNLGPKQIYVYKDLKVIFMHGKVADVQ